MKNHDEKHKDMMESVLPSRARKMARERRRWLHKQERACERIALARMAASREDAGLDFGEGRRKSDMRWLVFDRRSADNVGALTRWAVAIVGADPVLRVAPLHEQVAYFASILPGDLIGRHALQHIEWALKYVTQPPYWSALRAECAARDVERKREMSEGLCRILAHGRHGEFNRALRRAYARRLAACQDPGSLRLLLGAHDISAFVEETVRLDWIRETVRQLAVS